MTLIAMMSFFDEDDLLLKRSVRGLARIGVKRIVAVDGPYALFPNDGPYSNPQQICVLRQAAIQRGVDLCLFQPDQPWAGNETEKRQRMLDLALKRAYRGDWLVVWDCDYRLMDAPDPAWIRGRLQATDLDVATISFTEDPLAASRLSAHDFYPMAMFLRAVPGIKMDGNHHTYVLPDGRRSHILRRPVENEAEALDLGEVRILHDVQRRSLERRARQTAYYEARDVQGVEFGI
jgi:hypothetical protein